MIYDNMHMVCDFLITFTVILNRELRTYDPHIYGRHMYYWDTHARIRARAGARARTRMV